VHRDCSFDGAQPPDRRLALPDPIITLTTDFGTSDHLVGTMKGVILNINPAARIVDLNHHVAPFDVLDGALSIANAYSYFPPRTIHVIIVDPGVGTDRRPLLVSGEKQYFIAPDNGVLSVIFEREPCTVRHVTAEHYFLNPISSTFHGRDIFAPTAAWLSKAFQTEAFGEEITDSVRFTMPKPKATGQVVKGVVLRVDAFGNLMTNLTIEHVPLEAVEAGTVKLSVGGKEVRKLVQTFALGAPGEPVAVFGSAGFLEVAVNRGNASRTLGANRGAEVTLDLA
jgi:S-adenosyl-L-methionine hydrolase (adenosine-forming)